LDLPRNIPGSETKRAAQRIGCQREHPPAAPDRGGAISEDCELDGPGEITRLVERWSEGDDRAFDRLIELVYDDLRQIAHRHLRLDRLDQESAAAVEAEAAELLAVNEALDMLAQRNERMARVVECRFFGGLSVAETAEALDASVRKVERDLDACARVPVPRARHALKKPARSRTRGRRRSHGLMAHDLGKPPAPRPPANAYGRPKE
jgi:hypothetical protein